MNPKAERFSPPWFKATLTSTSDPSYSQRSTEDTLFVRGMLSPGQNDFFAWFQELMFIVYFVDSPSVIVALLINKQS